MIIKQGQVTFKIPDVHEIVNIVLTLLNGIRHPLMQISEAAMAERKKFPADGRPDFFCITGNKVTLHPRADKDYDATITYLPPAKQM